MTMKLNIGSYIELNLRDSSYWLLLIKNKNILDNFNLTVECI